MASKEITVASSDFKVHYKERKNRVWTQVSRDVMSVCLHEKSRLRVDLGWKSSCEISVKRLLEQLSFCNKPIQYYHTTQQYALSTAYIGKMILSQIVKKFGPFCGTRNYYFVDKNFSAALLNQKNPLYTLLSLRSTLILSSHIHLGFPRHYLSSHLQTESLCEILIFIIRSARPAYTTVSVYRPNITGRTI